MFGVGVVTGIGEVCGRPVVVVANDATVKAGSWWPETIPKKLANCREEKGVLSKTSIPMMLAPGATEAAIAATFVP